MRVGDFLPGSLWIERGVRGDYVELERFQYLRGRPATGGGVWRAGYERSEVGGQRSGRRVVGVAVVSWPVACMRGREDYFGMRGMRYGEKLRFANANIRTISRVIVHPQFRG